MDWVPSEFFTVATYLFIIWVGIISVNIISFKMTLAHVMAWFRGDIIIYVYTVLSVIW